MKTSKIFKKAFITSCALLVPFCELMAEAQDEKVYTAKYKFNYESKTVKLSAVGDQPAGTSFSYSGSYNRASRADWKDRVYLNAYNIGAISFTNFKYQVKGISFLVMAEPSANLFDNIKTTVTDYDDNPFDNTYRIGSSEGTYFHDNPFLDREFQSYLNGIKSMTFEQKAIKVMGVTFTNTVYYQGANDNTTPTFTIEYYKPYAAFNENMLTALKKDTKIALSRSMFTVFHQGAFTDSDFSFESQDPEIAKIENGYIVGVSAGVARISVVIKNNEKEVSRTTINVSVYGGDYCWSQGSLYMDFDPNGKIKDYASYTGKAYDGLRLFDDGDEKRPYEWTKYDEETNGNLSAAISTRVANNDWRVAVGMINYTQYVPAYASVKISYNFQVQTQMITKKCRNGAELLYFGETPWTENINDKFTTKIENEQSSGNFTSVCSVVGLDELQTASSNYSFNADNSENVEARNIQLRFGLKTFARRYYNEKADQMGSFNATGRQLETTYYAYVTFVGGEGCPYTMPKHDNGKNYKLYTSNNTSTSYTLPGIDERTGYTFKGWSTTKNGPVVYNNYGQFNPYDENTKGGKGYVTLYAVWEANTYKVTLDHNDGSNKKDVITATYDKDMPKLTNIPTRTGYTFRGYYEGKDYSQTDDYTTKYYNANGSSARKWDKTYAADLYAHWTAKTYTINFDACGGKLSDNVKLRKEDGSETSIKTSNEQSFVSFDVQYDSKIGDRFWCSEEITIKPGYMFLGWFTEKTGGTKVYSVGDNECSFNAIAGDYWTADGTNGDWKYDVTNGTLNLYAQYECKFEIVDNGERINFKKGYKITSYDILAAIEEDLATYNVSPMIVDVTNYQEYVLAGKGIGNFLSGKGFSVDENNNLEAFNTVIAEARDDNKLAPNALVYLSSEKSMNTGATNVVLKEEKQCQDLVVTDRAPIKIPYEFKADKALYERNKNYSSEDAAKAQAASSKWGTLCLPYPIKNNSNNVRFYKLAGFKNNYMHFIPMNVDVIPANTPVLYKRLDGVGSDVTIWETGVDVPMNITYSTKPGSSYEDWQFVGTLTTKVFCGKDYDDKKVPAGAEKLDGSKEIYYFKQDQFTHLKNTGKATALPYRAYFTTTASEAKVATFSIVALDEEGATDITDLIDSDAEADGKIYDLNGRRVMQPVSGRIYIVNGKKKVY